MTLPPAGIGAGIRITASSVLIQIICTRHRADTSNEGLLCLFTNTFVNLASKP